MEILRLVVISLLIILAIVLGSKVVYKDNFAILTGTITGDGTESPSKTINYPEGFTKSNCVVLSSNLQRSSTTSKAYGSVYDSSSYVAGAIPTKIALTDSNISLEIRNILLSNNSVNISELSSSVSYTYTIVLMKIGD